MPSSGCFSASTARSLDLTSSTRFDFSPPFQMSTAAAIPHKKLAGMRIPVLQAGRWNLQASEVEYNSIRNKKVDTYRFKPHIVPQRNIYTSESCQRILHLIVTLRTWNMEFPSFMKQIHKAMLIELNIGIRSKMKTLLDWKSLETRSAMQQEYSIYIIYRMRLCSMGSIPGLGMFKLPLF